MMRKIQDISNGVTKMLDISKFEILKDTDDSSVMRYSGEKQYVIYADSGYYTLSVRRPDG